jgi:stage IV sporulation protein FB
MLWRFNRLFNIRLRLHPLFTIILLLAVVTGRFLEVVTLFGIVLIHELGHAAAAKQFGWRLREIQLTPFGGVAVTDEDGAIPAKEEAVVALAGPAMNGLMIGFAYAMSAAGVWTLAWAQYFVQANLTLLLFNLLPLLPLDGGKVLRVSMGYILPYYKTLKITSFWSMLASASMIGFALTRAGTGGMAMNLLFIGSFLMYANWYEWKTVPYRFVRFLLGRTLRVKIWVHSGKTMHPLIVAHKASLSDVARLLMRERLHLIVIMSEDGKVLATLPESHCAMHFLEKDQNREIFEVFM